MHRLVFDLAFSLFRTKRTVERFDVGHVACKEFGARVDGCPIGHLDI